MALTLDNFTQDQIDELSNELTYNLGSYQPLLGIGYNLYVTGQMQEIDPTAPHEVAITIDYDGGVGESLSINAVGVFPDGALIAPLSELPCAGMANGLNVSVSRISSTRLLISICAPPTISPRGCIQGEQHWWIYFKGVVANTVSASVSAVTAELSVVENRTSLIKA